VVGVVVVVVVGKVAMAAPRCLRVKVPSLSVVTREGRPQAARVRVKEMATHAKTRMKRSGGLQLGQWVRRRPRAQARGLVQHRFALFGNRRSRIQSLDG